MNKLTIPAEMRGLLTGLAIAQLVVVSAVSLPYGIPGQELLGSLRLHIGIGALILPLLLSISGARLRGILVMAAVMLSLTQSAVIILQQQAMRNNLPAGAAPAYSLKLLSYNVLGTNSRPDDAVQFIDGSGADVVVLMEASGIGRRLPQLAGTYPYRVGCEAIQRCDLAILSKTPFLSTDEHILRAMQRSRLARATIEIAPGRQATIVAAHLTKPYFDDMAASDLLQVEKLLAGTEGPLVLAGDFNAAAWSAAIADLARSTELMPPPRYPATWPIGLGPLGIPIDNIFTRGPALIRTIEATDDSHGSNHLALVAVIDVF